MTELVAKGFNPRAVRVAVRDFKDSLVFAGLLVDGKLNLVDQPPSETDLMHDSHFHSEFLAGPMQKPVGSATRRYPIDISVARNLRAELLITGAGLRKEDLKRLEVQLHRLMVNLSDGFED